jgi:Holliday junction resolvase RusA-like endonuclease
LKVVSDALNKVAFHDDAQIASSQIHKLYTDDAPRVVIILSEVEAQSQGAT